MKLLGRMHQKLWQYSKDPFKGFTIGNSCACLSAKPSLDEQNQGEHSFGSIYGIKSLEQSEQDSQISFSAFKAERVEENIKEETVTVISELFHGFLAVGTLGYELVINEPTTPTFSISLDTITDEKLDVAEKDLKLVNDELEKFLDAEAKEGGYNESSGRNSYVSCITLGSKQMEGADVEDYGKSIICPLQEYLLGSSIEIPETRMEVKKEKTSLAELFHKTDLTYENYGDKSNRTEMQAKRAHKSAAPPIRKLVGKLLSSSKRSEPSRGSGDATSASKKNKLQKVLQMFHRKICPENSIAARELDKSHRSKKENAYGDRYNTIDLKAPDEDNRRFRKISISKDCIKRYKTNLNPSPYGINGSKSNKNKEHWDNTDSEYLVLEL